jgi:hypothetical protein
VKLPLGIRTVSEIAFETATGRYETQEAMEIAYYRLSEEINRELGDAQLLRKTVTSELTEESYILRCTVRCVENIGLVLEFAAE